ncbi:unnamed protein product [Diatraea saccharalis]|uniref:RanBP-type and C3HC4-type zinc finger-containing protein 1 n=1 Tax=Diatraea saccharalis TaxID=40085 RepID=A0A9P0C449_9NEOP|nr:unnamed protein product [Diatraea saccharalis]
MSGGVETGSTRPRPLSGGFWTLLSWLRGEDHLTSSESISSVGSDSTAVSFAFLAPAYYHAGAAPLVLPPPGPPTDSYKKRVRERNLRRQYDRDITLHRKYGLLRGESAVNFDVHTLPSPRRVATVNDRKDRDRRAASECLQRRTAHVPGKRRAPPPPTRTTIASNIVIHSGTTNRRHSRKRPAPKPPIQVTEKSKENDNIVFYNNNKINMNPSSSPDVNPLSSLGLDCKHEKYIKKEVHLKDKVKVRTEKSFLKQIFENKKRNSSVDKPLIKILPSISELDKQAAEIIETSRAKNKTQRNQHNYKSEDSIWYCMKCSKKYDKSMDFCLICKIKKDVSCTPGARDARKNATIYTQTEQQSISPCIIKNKEMEEKQKLKEMLKEMKDSLPKRTKSDDLSKDNKIQSKSNLPLTPSNKIVLSLETPTLPIGYSNERNKESIIEPSVSNQSSKSNFSDNLKLNEINIQRVSKVDETRTENRKALDTPLKISSLLNPIYIPKLNSSHQERSEKILPSLEVKPMLEKKEPPPTDQIYIRAADAVREILLNTAAIQSPKPSSHVPKHVQESTNKFGTDNVQNTSSVGIKNLSNVEKHQFINTEMNDIEKLNNHSRRRNLVNQLEKSIANGDEGAAAEAAKQLAQLRLSCSVLSFSSQILQNKESPPQIILKNKNMPNANNKENHLSLLSKESLGKSVALPSKRLTENKKTLESHDASTSTNNIPIKKNKILTKVETETKNQSYKVKERPNDVKNEAIPTIAVAAISHDVSRNSLPKSDIEFVQNKNYKKDTSRSEPDAQPSTSKEKKDEDNFKSISVWIEDKDKAHGPIRMRIAGNAVVGELRRQAEIILGLPMRLQRWIVGKELCNNDETTLVSLAGLNLDAPFYLCVVESDKNIQNHIRDLCQVENEKSTKNANGEESGGVYNELVKLEQQALVPNAEAFECEICMEQCGAGNGIVLRECVHSFCRQCLIDVIRHCEEPAVSCPAMGCRGLLHEREIRALVSPEEYQKWLDRGLAAAESGTRNAFHCRTRDCTGWALCETGARHFPCPVCKHVNCVPCQAIHEGETCEVYRTKLKEAAVDTTAQTDEGTQALIQSLINRGEALQCPECNAVITKKWGCDWVKCSACKTEICWVTRGRRWGPGGRGDTSGGCKCGVDGKRCHPSCGYCH